jgi:hypothetical protein
VRFVVIAILSLALVSPAGAVRPCWKTVVADWFADGRFDSSHPCRCYQEALRHLPATGESWGLREALADQARRACHPPRARPRAN